MEVQTAETQLCLGSDSELCVGLAGLEVDVLETSSVRVMMQPRV